MYLVFGVLTTVVNIVVYYVAADCLKINYLIANIAAWFLSVLFAYVTNRKYVFESKSDHILKEMISFFSARLATGALDMGFMYVSISKYSQILLQRLLLIYLLLSQIMY